MPLAGGFNTGKLFLGRHLVQEIYFFRPGVSSKDIVVDEQSRYKARESVAVHIYANRLLYGIPISTLHTLHPTNTYGPACAHELRVFHQIQALLVFSPLTADVGHPHDHMLWAANLRNGAPQSGHRAVNNPENQPGNVQEKRWRASQNDEQHGLAVAILGFDESNMIQMRTGNRRQVCARMRLRVDYLRP